MIKESCSPNPNNPLKFTCYTPESLLKMKALWNVRHPDRKIVSTTSRGIWKELKSSMNDVCEAESCWLKQKFIKHDLDPILLNYTFAPKSPKEWKKNPTEWLSSIDIIEVMKQYEFLYSCFSFLGPSPIDYDNHLLDGECVWEELCHFDLLEYIKEHRNKIGIIFNLDEHDKDGSHWVALFIHLPKRKIIYFDSYGDEPPRQIIKFMNTVCKQASALGLELEKIINRFEHQQSESECGMYSLYFIIHMLLDTPLSELLESRIPDEKMMKLRNKYFRVEK